MTASLADSRCLVTGGAGFIGSHLAERLRDAGATVVVLDDLSTGRRANVPAGVRFVEGSILDAAALAACVRGCDLVFHLAAMVSVPQSVAEPRACHEINVRGTHETILAARDAGVRRIVFASSCAVYGARPRLPSRETDPIEPASPYAASKAAGEALLAAHAHCDGADGVALRFFNVYGPRQDPRSAYAAVIAAFAGRLAEGRAPTIFGDGAQTRDFVHVHDVARACLAAATAPGLLRGAAFNVGTGRAASLRELAAAMSAAAGFAGPPEHAPPRAGDVPHSCADVAPTRERLGFAADTPWEDGVVELVRGGDRA